MTVYLFQYISDIVLFIIFRMILEELWILAYCILSIVQLSLGRATHRCREPQLDNNCLNDGPFHESFLMMEPEVTLTYDVESFVNIQRTKIEGSPGYDQCAWQTGRGHNLTCPHHYVVNYDPNRRPKTLMEAKCNCSENMRCLNGGERSRCVPIKYFIYVMRKNGCHKGLYTYRQTVEPITVGCTCAHENARRLHENDIRYFTPE